MFKKTISIFAGFIMLAAVSPAALGWGSATHAYIADVLNRSSGKANLNEMYGAMVSDLFNYMFDYPYQDYLADQTHGMYDPVEDVSAVLKLWDRAHGELQKAIAFGFVSHNDVWGEDSTAHYKGIPAVIFFDGYIRSKARDLDFYIQLTAPPGDLLNFYMSLSAATREEICHNIVETAGDILIMMLADNTIGQKMMSAAMARRPELPSMLNRVYARDFAEVAGIKYSTAQKIIRTAENEFRNTTISYGYALTQDVPTAMLLLSQQMAQLAPAYIGELPPGITLEHIAQFINLGFWLSLPLTDSPFVLSDYMNQVGLTIPFVNQKLIENGIIY